MPIVVTRNEEESVAVAFCFDRLTEAEAVESIAFAFASKIMEPSINRVLVLDPDTQLHDLDMAALQRIQKRILEQELQGGGEISYRSVLVYSSQVQKTLMKLYKAIWEMANHPGVEFFVVASEAEAWRALNVAPFAFQRRAG